MNEYLGSYYHEAAIEKSTLKMMKVWVGTNIAMSSSKNIGEQN
jgi:hypothetical protein